jgi:hypothetical protein
LTNGAYQLASQVRVKATNAANPDTAFAPLTGANNPLTLLAYDRWISNDWAMISIKQSVAAGEALRAGNYGITIRFTLSTTEP